jgi:hypothetical protein
MPGEAVVLVITQLIILHLVVLGEAALGRIKILGYWLLLELQIPVGAVGVMLRQLGYRAVRV